MVFVSACLKGVGERAFKRGQLDKVDSVDFHRCFSTFFEESTMLKRRSMDETKGFMQLFASKISQRQITRALGIYRKFVARELRPTVAKGTTDGIAPTGCSSSDTIASKGAKAPTGSVAGNEQ